MDSLSSLNQRLRLICGLLDGAASMVRDIPLSPTNDHIRRVGEALASLFEIQRAIYRLRPELEVPYEEPPEEIAAANRRLGEALIAAYDLADAQKVAEAIAFLGDYIRSEPLREYSELAERELERMKRGYEV